MKRYLVCLILMFMCVAMVMVGCKKKAEAPEESLLRDHSFMVAQVSEMPAQEQAIEQPAEEEEQQGNEEEEYQQEQEESEQEEEQVLEGC
ncbi:MAG: hypothetical protein AMJ45_00445 [Syntrophobacter sp. DG_60]|nr:MAG: hypothetical protein AMJ45_00445 [Syntrophobacter sp. DG_60]